ncbi:PAS domain S-box protein, partial [candidate division KSB1 bacterium]|nr:PAS domain S-box protein [candidate division KSB1 bacterium]
MSDKILVVDDDLMVCKTIVDVLNQEGLKATGVNSGKKALSLLYSSNWDLALLDIVMDEMDGIELLDRIREKTTDLPILMITGYGSIQTALMAIKKGADDYLLKPCEPETITFKIKSAIKTNKMRLEQIADKENSEATLQEAYRELENKVKFRTAELTNANKELQKSEEKYRSLVEKMSEGLMQCDNDNIICFVNEEMCKMLGYSRDELIGKSSLMLLVDENDRKFVEKKSRLRQKGKSDRYEIRIKKKLVEIIWVQVSGAPTFDAKGKIMGNVGIFLDITERKMANEALRLSEEKYRTLTENINTGIFRTTPGAKGKIIEANRALVNMFGYRNRKAFLKRHASDFYKNKKDRVKFSRKLKKFGDIKNDEQEFVRKDGSTFIGSETVVATKDETGRVIFFEGVIDDITERKKAEQSLIEAKNYLEKLHNSIGDAVFAVKMPERKIEYVNDSVKKVYGYDPEECLGNSAEMFYKD